MDARQVVEQLRIERICRAAGSRLGADQQSARGDFLRHEVRGPHDASATTPSTAPVRVMRLPFAALADAPGSVLALVRARSDGVAAGTPLLY
jgi:hypothetical protein